MLDNNVAMNKKCSQSREISQKHSEKLEMHQETYIMML